MDLWHTLPVELQELALNKLPLGSKRKAAMVCKSMRDVVHAVHPRTRITYCMYTIDRITTSEVNHNIVKLLDDYPIGLRLRTFRFQSVTLYFDYLKQFPHQFGNEYRVKLLSVEELLLDRVCATGPPNMFFSVLADIFPNCKTIIARNVRFYSVTQYAQMHKLNPEDVNDIMRCNLQVQNDEDTD
jgi:hypothetical protein